MEMTFAMIKPNGVKSGLIGRILDRYTSARLSVVGLKLHQMTSEEARGFYAEHVNKPFFPELEAYMTKGPSVMIALAGENAIAAVRAINGATNPAKAEPGTLRYDFAPSMTENVVHSSDSPASAEREVAFWFKKEDLYEYEAASNKACTVLG
ncbi:MULTISPECIES: nucleoside-diphosphate kinase [Hallerella]|jgi:nucleoside-diphosphate kinase|uniref:Nucleoside diphosphate kinase n=2 Tax=Hallerella succinigenes TaxID=1896222 RepID=A0A2M9A4E6_9BACT|nr:MULTISPECIES: nucleoside-diphosphate kinase [Hallerella]MBS7392591.1 nucleoside-diphosphate kinase [Fibrobacter sp.]MCI6874420.1 nucleoside-diphosphate kinase [Hallerella sp.]MCR5029642.1 nucleoside-diphosphate kinase [Fibrobacter sp.]MDD6092492.1 nucleoside-diphosphate kinase [Hallerella succinigenes]PJJ40528.1 nucleoside diphosphate kinase [Hallerella succinigenes]